MKVYIVISWDSIFAQESAEEYCKMYGGMRVEEYEVEE